MKALMDAPPAKSLVMYCYHIDTDGAQFMEVGGFRCAHVPLRADMINSQNMLGRHATVSTNDNGTSQIENWHPIHTAPDGQPEIKWSPKGTTESRVTFLLGTALYAASAIILFIWWKKP